MTMRTVMFFGGFLAGVLLSCSAPAALTELPDGYLLGWGGKSTYFVNLGSGQYLYGVIEFAVYDTRSVGYSWVDSPGDHRFVYAYQIFSDSDATAAMTYFGLTGINPLAIESAENNLGTAASADGVDPKGAGVNLSKTKAFFEFEDGVLIHDEKSVILLLGSDFLPVIGGYEVTPSSDDEVPIPGDGDTPPDNNGDPIPEPGTLSLLLGGVLLSLRRRK